MDLSAFYAWLHDKFLASKWVKYLLFPGIEALPTTAAALYVGLGNTTFHGSNSAWLVFYASLLGGALAAGRAALTESGQQLISTKEKVIASLNTEKEQLLRLVGHVRVIVSAKSRRFHESLKRLPDPVEAGVAFLTITQPDEQIAEIVRNIHEYFRYFPTFRSKELLTVALMRWNDTGRHLEYASYFPHNDLPRTSPAEFHDNTTIAGKAFFEQTMVISENLRTDPNYKKLAGPTDGSMFAYPVWDDFDRKVVFVINVVSSIIQRFNETERDLLTIPMQVFAERLLLENRLRDLKGRVKS
ncbi:MAG: GAF domain-containing protein [Candidatus Binatus sp.]|jgi:hypothetical protein